jgi:hypothetical protein
MANVTQYNIAIPRIEIAVCESPDYFQIVNHEYPYEIYLEKQIVDQFKTRELLEPLTEHNYLIPNYKFLSFNDSTDSRWEISRSYTMPKEVNFPIVPPLVFSIAGKPQIDHQKIICLFP